jgi:hypothetical protein
VLALLVDIDMTMAGWVPDGKGSVPVWTDLPGADS